MIEKKRLDYIDLAKAICIILVIFAHVCHEFKCHMAFESGLRMFRIPLYFCLSGMFFKEYKGIFDFIRRKTNKLLIPFAFFLLITSFIIPTLLIDYCNYDWYVKGWRLLWSWLWEREHLYNGSLWFLLCLFESNIIFYCIYLLAKRSAHKTTLLICYSGILGIGGFALRHFEISIPMYFDTMMTAMPFFCFGYILFRHSNVLKEGYFLDKWLIPISILFLSVPFFWNGSSKWWDNDVNPRYAYISGISGTLGVLAITKKIQRIPIVSYIGRYSIVSLCLNSFVIHVIGPVIDRIPIPIAIKIAILFFLTVSICLCAIPLFKRYMPWVIAQKDIWKEIN